MAVGDFVAIYGEFSFLGYFLLGLFFFLFWFSCLGSELVFFPVVVLCCLVGFCFSILGFFKRKLGSCYQYHNLEYHKFTSLNSGETTISILGCFEYYYGVKIK